MSAAMPSGEPASAQSESWDVAEQVQRRAKARQAALDCIQILLAGVSDLDIGDATRFERCLIVAGTTLADHVAILEDEGRLS